jgi:probable F420-dependent oxidoreductase
MCNPYSIPTESFRLFWLTIGGQHPSQNQRLSTESTRLKNPRDFSLHFCRSRGCASDGIFDTMGSPLVGGTIVSARVGIAVPIQHSLTVPEGVELAQQAEAAGYESIWIPEVIGVDAFVLMTAMAGATTQLRLGTGIVPILTRTPSLMAMTAASIAQLAPGRLRLGLGVSTSNIIQNWHGILYDRPLARIRDYVTIIRQALAGVRVTHEAGVYPVRNFRLGLSAPQPSIPVYVAALNPRMLQLAGEVADGVLLNWIPAEQVPWALGHLSRGANKAGRTLADLDIACLVRVCVTDDVNAARQWLRRELTGYTIVEAYQQYFRQLGFENETEAVLAKWRAGDRSGAVEEVPNHMTDRLALFGSAAQCQLRLGRFVEAGVNLPIVFPFSPEADYRSSIHRTLTELGPGR